MYALMSHPAGGAWIEGCNDSSSYVVPASSSHPAGGAWIEGFGESKKAEAGAVAPRRGCVD